MKKQRMYQIKFKFTGPFAHMLCFLFCYNCKQRARRRLLLTDMACAWKVLFVKYVPHLLMVSAQISFAFLYFIVEASFNQGLNPHIFIAYRYLVGGLVMSPIAYLLERKSRPKLTLALSLEIFFVSFVGTCITINLHFASLKYTSPAFVTAMTNTISSMTFVAAIIFRMEVVDVKNPRGIAKILGTLISLAGIMIMTLYKGTAEQKEEGALILIRRSYHEKFLEGSILLVVSCITWSIWYIMQANTLTKYPAPISLAAWMISIGGAQSSVFAALVQHKPAAWSIKLLSLKFWCILYAGLICSGMTNWAQVWCMKQKGPVFVTMFAPLSTVMVAIFAYFIFGEKLYMGSIIGGVIVIIGLYLLLWGKERDQAYCKTHEAAFSQGNEQKVEDITSVQREAP